MNAPMHPMTPCAFARRAIPVRGFTLVEVMIVVAIVAILAAIAYPSYTEYVRRGQRAQARTVLLEAAQFMQRFYAANDRYDQIRGGGAVTLPGTLTNGAAHYTITLRAVNPTNYTLQAAPTGGLAGDRCGTFTLNSTGARGLEGSSATVAECWR